MFLQPYFFGISYAIELSINTKAGVFLKLVPKLCVKTQHPVISDTHQELDWLQCFSGNVPQRKRKEKEKAQGQRLAINSKVKG